MHKRSYYIINGITFYRLVAAPLLVLLIIFHRPEVFKWLLAVSFFTDAIDGFLARRYKVISAFGSKLDSLADDVTIIAAITGVVVFKPEFIQQHIIPLIILMLLYIVQVSFALTRYGRLSSFHTWSAKIAAVGQAIFLLLFFFLPQPVDVIFYTAVIATGINLVEEIILVWLLPEWKTDVKGLYWVLKKKPEGYT